MEFLRVDTCEACGGRPSDTVLLGQEYRCFCPATPKPEPKWIGFAQFVRDNVQSGLYLRSLWPVPRPFEKWREYSRGLTDLPPEYVCVLIADADTHHVCTSTQEVFDAYAAWAKRTVRLGA